MGHCTIHLNGSHASLDMISSRHLAVAMHCKSRAIAATYSALAHWEAAYAEDIRGQNDRCLQRIDQALDQAVLATSRWKAAEYQQSRLIAHFMTLPKHLALRDSTDGVLSVVDFRQMLDQLQNERRLPPLIDFKQVRSIQDFGIQLFGIKTPQVVLLSGEDGITQLINILLIELHQIRQLKLDARVTWSVMQTLHDDACHVQLFERISAGPAPDSPVYPLRQSIGQLRNDVSCLNIYIEAYGCYLSNVQPEPVDDEQAKAQRLAYLDA